MQDLFPIRIHAENGLLALRDGLIFVLYIRKAHVDICQNVEEMYDEYVKLVGDDALEWVHDRGEFYRPFTTQKKTRIRKLLSPEFAEKIQDELFTIKGGCGESDAAAFLFKYQGRDMKGRLADVNASFVEMWFPTDFPEMLGYDAFVKGLQRIAAKVPFTSGYCSLGLSREEWAVMGTDEFVRSIAVRHPGIDVNDTMSTAIRIGEDVRGAYWLTFLGDKAIETLQLNAKDIASCLGPDITVEELPNGISIRSGKKPEPGDINRQEKLQSIRKVASLIKPVQHIQTVGIFGFEEVDEFVDWQTRHLL